MPESQSTPLIMSSPATYSIKVKGRLSDSWADWFNGTLINYVRMDHGAPETLLTCRVRDQAELLGILKQINALNLPLIQVILVEGRRKTDAAECWERRH